MTLLQCLSPSEGSVFAARQNSTALKAAAATAEAHAAQRDRAAGPLADRIVLVPAGVSALGAIGDRAVMEAAHMIRQPVRCGGPLGVGGFHNLARPKSCHLKKAFRQ
ncbi:MAG: hypothetical protein QNJ44_16990 [Rhodobacter sp.]|nr:hypothetical protein [Rhodobacter sp.]